MAGASVLAPQSANAQATQTLLYTEEIKPGTASAPKPPESWFAKAVLTEVLAAGGNPGGFDVTFTSNFGTVDEFANDFWFALDNQNASSLASLTATCIPGTGTLCVDPPLLSLDPNSPDGLAGWTFRLNTAPDPGNKDYVLNGAGETISFEVRGDNLSFATLGVNREGYVSCFHGQGLPNLSESSMICTSDGTPPPTTTVPGPLPVLGAAAAFGYSRKIRTRIQSSRQQATIS